MDYREEHERARRYRDDDDYRVSDRRWERRDWDRRDHERGRGDEAGFLERFIDDLRSWFRDEDARRRGGERGGWGGAERGWGGRADEEVDRGWAKQWGYVDRADARERSRSAPRSEGAWARRERGYVDEGYERGRESGERYYEPRWGWGDPSAWGAEPSGSFERGRGGAASGPHAGRGPRGYQRSDERIREDVCDTLCQHGYVDASDIEVTVLNGEVTLVGVVRERPEKRIAEDAAEQVPGVREVHNQLRVSPGGSGQEPHERPGDPRFRVA